MRRAASCARKAVAMPISSMLTKLRAGAFALALSSSSSNSGIPDAARVASGPGEMACHADALGSKLRCNITHRALKRRFGNAHDVVVLHDHLAAVIGYRKERPALAHQRLCQMRHADEGPAGHIHGGEKSLLRYVDYAALQRVLGRKRNGVNGKVQFSPFFRNAGEYRLHLT